MTPADRAILRVKEEMTRLNLSQRDLAKRLKCSQGRIAKMITGRQKLQVNDLAMLAEAVGLTLSETIRDRDLEFFAEMSGIEVDILLTYRKKSMEMKRAFMTFLGMEAPAVLPEPKHILKSVRGKPGRPLNSSKRHSG